MSNKFIDFLSSKGKKLKISKYENYYEIYDNHFRKYKNTNPIILEIGVQGGGSLEMWNYYFDNTQPLYHRVKLNNFIKTPFSIKENLIQTIYKTKKQNNINHTIYNLKYSKVLIAIINNKKCTTKLTYSNLIDETYFSIADTNHIKKNSKINIKFGEEKIKGFKYLPTLDISYQRCDANKSFYEIKHQCEKYNLNYYFKIKLKSTEIIEFKY